MTRLMTISTVMGLFGLGLAMITALIGAQSVLLAFGFALMVLGLFGALCGAAASLAHARQSAR